MLFVCVSAWERERERGGTKNLMITFASGLTSFECKWIYYQKTNKGAKYDHSCWAHMCLT